MFFSSSASFLSAVLTIQLTVLDSDSLWIQTTHRFQDLSYIKTACNMYDSSSVATDTCHFEDSSDLGVSDLRTVNCIQLLLFGNHIEGHSTFAVLCDYPGDFHTTFSHKLFKSGNSSPINASLACTVAKDIFNYYRSKPRGEGGGGVIHSAPEPHFPDDKISWSWAHTLHTGGHIHSVPN
jgi:hypothetical protein